MATRFRMPFKDDDRDRLTKLLVGVPTRTIVQYDWTTDAGREFIAEIRRVQVQEMVPLNLMCETLGVPYGAVDGAITYWNRHSISKARKRDRNNAARNTGKQGATTNDSEKRDDQ